MFQAVSHPKTGLVRIGEGALQRVRFVVVFAPAPVGPFRGGRAVRRGRACGPWTAVRQRLTEVCYSTHDHESLLRFF